MTGISIPVKYLMLTTAASLATFLCFWLMQLLISAELSKVTEISPYKISTPFLSPIREKEKREVRKKPQKVMPSVPPPIPDGLPTLSPTRVLTESNFPIRASLSDILGSERIMINMTPPVKDLVPIFMVQPIYPFVAVVKEIEGYVLIQFSVSENGSVSDVVILDSEPRYTFDDAALSAIRKFRFTPREVGGDPITAEQIQMRFAFTMESAYAH